MKNFTKNSFMQKAILISFAYYAMTGLGIALSTKADIGVTCFNALLLTISDITSLKVGTITTISNILFLIGCYILDKDRKIVRYVIMFLAQICFGYVINFFLYNVLGQVELTNYFIKILFFFMGLVTTCFAVGRILYYRVLQFPIENFCNLVSEKTKHSMKFYRYGIDIIGVTGSLALSFAFHLPIYVGVGTIISLFLFSSIMSWSFSLKGIDKR